MSISSFNHRCAPLLESLAYRLPHHPQVSDSSGFGTGGTSTPVTVLQSSDSSCYDTTQSVQGPWVFSVSPTGGITQCESVRLWWEQQFVNGCVSPFLRGRPSLFGYLYL